MYLFFKDSLVPTLLPLHKQLHSHMLLLPNKDKKNKQIKKKNNNFNSDAQRQWV